MMFSNSGSLDDGFHGFAKYFRVRFVVLTFCRYNSFGHLQRSGKMRYKRFFFRNPMKKMIPCRLVIGRFQNPRARSLLVIGYIWFHAHTEWSCHQGRLIVPPFRSDEPKLATAPW